MSEPDTALQNRWRIVSVPGQEPYFERHSDGQWAQREVAEAEITRLTADLKDNETAAVPCETTT